MIFGSFGLLVLAVIFLIAAIIKSSVALGVGSLICTILAAGFLLAANAYYKKLTLDAQYGEGEGGDSQLRRMATTGGTAAPGAAVAGNGGVMRGGTPMMAPVMMAPAPVGIVDGYDLLSAAQATALVDTLNLEELHATRRFEVEHEARKTVLAAIDRRIEAVVAVRKQVAVTE